METSTQKAALFGICAAITSFLIIATVTKVSGGHFFQLSTREGFLLYLIFSWGYYYMEEKEKRGEGQ